MTDPPKDKGALKDALHALNARDLEVSEGWITDTELDANPGLVKTMSVQPPRGSGHIRLVRIDRGDDQIDLQPCDGTPVTRSLEIGSISLGKIEKKDARNRRVYIHLDEGFCHNCHGKPQRSKFAQRPLAHEGRNQLNDARWRGGRVVEGARLESV
jgi:alanyl-tRNA synthetase